MSRFKRIKNTSTKKSSVSIDEKIAALNQELEKTGMSNVSEMTTDDVYVTGTEEPNPAYEDFIAASFGGKGFAMSGFGGASIGGATFDTNGLAFGPDGSGPATSYLGLSSGFGPAVPGSQRTPGHRKIGAFLWYWNGSGYSTLEWKFNNQNVDNTGGWASWQDTAFGFPHLVFISAIPGFDPALAAAVASAGGGGAFPDPDDVTPPTNPVFTKDRLGEPSFLPIDIAKRKAGGDMGTSPEAFDSFSEKSKGDKGEGDKGEDDKGEEDDQEEFDAEKEKLYQENIRKLAQLLRMSEKEFMRKAEALGYMTYLRNILYAKDPAALKIAHKFMVSQYHGLSKIIGQITGLKTAANMLVTYDRYIGSGSTAPLDVTNQVDRGSMVKLMRAVQKAKQSSKYKSYQKSLAKIDSGESKANRNDVLDLMRDAVRESLQKTTKPDVSIGGFNIYAFNTL